jgi:peptidoglycan/LPS O-acetylase OafA/YrhL
MKYIKQLDSIRALAVILVIIWHWVPRNSFVENLHAGILGVNIFFVLSGFLITEILLINRKKAEDSITSKTHVLRSFYVRRILRIFPIYYLTIFLTLILSHKLSLEISRNEMLSNITYTSNFFIYITREWPESSLHFWSLAVEEQFYLAWPLFVLFWPKKTLLPLMLFFIATGMISQLLINDYEFGYLPTYTCLDCFGIGGLLAFIVVHLPLSLQKFYRLLSILSIAAVVVLVVCWNLNFYLPNTRFVHGILSAWVISHILIYKEKKSLLVSLLNCRLLISIGKVSYGIYLYHILYVYFANKYWYKYVYDHYSAFINEEFEPWIFTVVNFGILYLIGWLSWKFIEKPVLSLKRKFQYR